MAYRNYDELIDDANKDPKLAKMRVAKAKQSNTPVVNSENSGYDNYRQKAIAKRMGPKPISARGVPPTKKTSEKYSKAIEERMKGNTPPQRQARGSTEEEIVTKRKKYGY